MWKTFKLAILKDNLPMDVPYFIKEHIWVKTSDEAISKKNLVELNPPKMDLKNKMVKNKHSCDCCDYSWSCQQLEKGATHKHFEKKVRLWTIVCYHHNTWVTGVYMAYMFDRCSAG